MAERNELVMPVWPDAAKLLGIGKQAAYDMARTGKLPILRVGRKILVLRKPLLKMLGADADAA